MSSTEEALLERWCDIALDEDRARRFRARLQRQLPQDQQVGQGRRRRRQRTRQSRPTWLAPVALLAAAMVGGVLLWTASDGQEVDRSLPQDTPVATDPTDRPTWLGQDWSSPSAARSLQPSGIGRMDLAAGSRLVAPATAEEAWQLTAGRAAFDIQPQPEGRPFRVVVAGAEVVVLGTRFVADAGDGVVHLQEGHVRLDFVDGQSRILQTGETSLVARGRPLAGQLQAHWPLDGGLVCGPQPALRGQGGTDPDSLSVADRGLQPGAVLLCDAAELATGSAFTVACRYRPTRALGQEAKALLRRMDLAVEPAQGFHLVGRPVRDDWRLAATLRQRDGAACQLLLPDPWEASADTEIALRLAYDGTTWRWWLDGVLVAEEAPSAPYLPAGQAPFVIGPAPGWIRDVWVWDGVVAP